STNTKQIPHSRFDGDADVSLARVRALPQLSRVPSLPRPKPSEPTFALTENVITLRDVGPEERLNPERIEVLRLTGEAVDLVATRRDRGLKPEVAEDPPTTNWHPGAGPNGGKIPVRARPSGRTQVLRVEAFVHEPAAADAPEPAPPGPAQSPPRHEVPDTPA